MLNWLVIGIGDITTKRVLPAIVSQPRSLLYGIVTREPRKGYAYCGNVWTELREALTDPAIDAVYVASPVFLHAPLTIASLEAGKHVLCEKPMAMNYAEAGRMVEAARRAGRTLGIAYYRRMYPKLQRARELIEAGAIGKPVLAEASCHDWFNDEDGRRSWLLDPAKAGGGPLYDIASHRIDALNFLFGEPQRATGQLSSLVHKAAVEDSASVLIEYVCGVRAIVDARRHCHVARDDFRITGIDGVVDLSPLNGPRLAWPLGEEILPAHENLHYPCLENFVSAVLDGAHLYSSGETAIWTDWVTERVLATTASETPAR